MFAVNRVVPKRACEDIVALRKTLEFVCDDDASVGVVWTRGMIAPISHAPSLTSGAPVASVGFEFIGKMKRHGVLRSDCIDLPAGSELHLAPGIALQLSGCF